MSNLNKQICKGLSEKCKLTAQNPMKLLLSKNLYMPDLHNSSMSGSKENSIVSPD